MGLQQVDVTVLPVEGTTMARIAGASGGMAGFVQSLGLPFAILGSLFLLSRRNQAGGGAAGGGSGDGGTPDPTFGGGLNPMNMGKVENNVNNSCRDKLFRP
jgi:hypothetical protein